MQVWEMFDPAIPPVGVPARNSFFRLMCRAKFIIRAVSRILIPSPTYAGRRSLFDEL